MISTRPSAHIQSLLGWLTIAAGLLGTPTVALAADNNATCLDAYAEGQRARKQSALMHAKESFLFCASDLCPKVMHSDCKGWLSEVDAAIPKNVFKVTSQDGTELTDVMITVDQGQPHSLDGQPIALDPGAHVFEFTRSGYRELRERFVLAQGETLVRHVVLEPLHETQSAAPLSAPLPEQRADVNSGSASATMWPAWVAAGVGVAGMAGFAYFGLHGRSEDRALDSCSPTCSVESTDAVRRDYLIANVSLGVGAVGLLSAGAWVLLAPSAAKGKSNAAFDVQLGPITWLRHKF